MVPVDGGVTLDLDGMVEVLEALKAPLMIPMHYFSTYSLRRFLDVLGEKSFEVEIQRHRRRSWCPRPRCRASRRCVVLPGRAF